MLDGLLLPQIGHSQLLEQRIHGLW
jgi:hypothetical protein